MIDLRVYSDIDCTNETPKVDGTYSNVMSFKTSMDYNKLNKLYVKNIGSNAAYHASVAVNNNLNNNLSVVINKAIIKPGETAIITFNLVSNKHLVDTQNNVALTLNYDRLP